jgi:hypothetical protein
MLIEHAGTVILVKFTISLLVPEYPLPKNMITAKNSLTGVSMAISVACTIGSVLEEPIIMIMSTRNITFTPFPMLHLSWIRKNKAAFVAHFLSLPMPYHALAAKRL